jgi:hypothetical protein
VHTVESVACVRMAEVVGVIASGVSIGCLVTQIGSSIIKLKGYWDEVQEAPEVVHALIENIEDLHSLLADIEDDQTRNPISALLLDVNSRSKCLTHCRKAAGRLEKLLDNLRADIDTSRRIRKKWAGAKVLLNKDKLGRYKIELERTMRLLSLSEQAYTRSGSDFIPTFPISGFFFFWQWYLVESRRLILFRSLLRLQPDIIISKFSETIGYSQIQMHPMTDDGNQIVHKRLAWMSNRNSGLSISESCNCSSGLPRNSRISDHLFSHSFCKKIITVRSRGASSESRKVRQDMKKFVLSVRAPVWLINKVWEIQFVRTCNGWNFGISACTIISGKSLVFRCVESGNIEGLQELFQRREASPFDRMENGFTVLHVSIIFKEFKSLQY